MSHSCLSYTIIIHPLFHSYIDFFSIYLLYVVLVLSSLVDIDQFFRLNSNKKLHILCVIIKTLKKQSINTALT